MRIVGTLTEQPARTDAGTVADGQEGAELRREVPPQAGAQRSQLLGTRPMDLLVGSPNGSVDDSSHAIQGDHGPAQGTTYALSRASVIAIIPGA